MSVTYTSWNLSATGDGTTTDFLCAFPLMRLEDLKVYVDDVLLTETRDYTVINVTKTSVHTIDPNFSVRFVEAPAVDADIYIRRQTPRRNSNKLYSGDKFKLPVFENNYDNIVMMAQEIGGLILDGFQGPIPEEYPIGEWEPDTDVSFFPAQVMTTAVSGQYTIRATAPAGSGWVENSLPVIDLTAAEINGRTDFSVGDIVLALPLENSADGLSWRFVGSTACTPYGGGYLEVAQCNYTSVDQPVYVRDDEFSANDTFLLNAACYTVLSDVPASTPDPGSVIRLADVTSTASCAACTDTGTPWPDPEEPPIPPLPANLFRDMIRCSDDDDSEYSLPIEVMGVPVAEDLTKIYSLPDDIGVSAYTGTCYSVGEVDFAQPNNPLFPIGAADVYDDCTLCSCDPSLTNCGFCDDTTPTSYQVTFSDIKTCTGCVLDQNTGIYVNVSYRGDFNLNDSFTLTQDGSCTWNLTVADALTIQAFTDSACTNAYTAALASDLVIQLSKGPTSWELWVYIGGIPTGPLASGTGAFSDYLVTALTDGGDQLCSSLPSFTNDATLSSECGNDNSTGDGSVFFYEGRATVVCG